MVAQVTYRQGTAFSRAGSQAKKAALAAEGGFPGGPFRFGAASGAKALGSGDGLWHG